MVAGTGATNVIPGLLTLTFNFRYSPESTRESLTAETSAQADAVTKVCLLLKYLSVEIIRFVLVLVRDGHSVRQAITSVRVAVISGMIIARFHDIRDEPLGP